VTETVESVGVGRVDPSRVQIVIPDRLRAADGRPEHPLARPPLEAGERLHGPKMVRGRSRSCAPTAQPHGARPPNARFGILTGGKAYLDTRQALEDLGARTPFFCSGCPHNTSTKVPEGSQGHGRHRLPRHGDVDARRAPAGSRRWAAKA
jgi:hypothetical protein